MIWALPRQFTDPLLNASYLSTLEVWIGGYPSLVAMDTLCSSLELATSILQGTNAQPHYFIVQVSILKVT